MAPQMRRKLTPATSWGLIITAEIVGLAVLFWLAFAS